MAGRRSSKRDKRFNKATARTRRRLVGWGTGAGAVLAFGLSPLVGAPSAQADVLDVIIDPLINAIGGSLSGLVDPLASLDLFGGANPFASLDLSGLSLPALDLPALDAAGASGLGTGSLDSALQLPTESLVALSSTDPLSAASSSSTDLAQLYDTFFYEPIHTLDQAWIASPFGALVDNNLNAVYQDFGGQGILIGNGVDGTMADPNGGAGGLFFGDGGTGYDPTTAGVAGGEGGAAFFGNGGDGGMGGADADGGAGGSTVFGIAGNGGAGGAGLPGADGGDGGAGGNVTGFFFGNGGNGGAGGAGGAGADGGPGADG